MAYVISDSCVSCGTCEPECPVELSHREIHSSTSTLTLALSVVHVQVFAQQALSLRANNLIKKTG